ncbi:IclR family transcriptional regulator [Streptomyces thermocoprophilus]
MSQTVDRALSILPMLAEGPADLGQVAARLGVHKSTALRLLRTLDEHGLVYRQSDQRYRLGARLFALAQEAMESLDIREIAHPPTSYASTRSAATPCTSPCTRRARSSTSTRSTAATRSACTPVSADRSPSPSPPSPNSSSPTCPSPSGAPSRRSSTTPATRPVRPPDAAAFLAELERVREQGWATDLGGHEESINCVAAPVRGADGRVVAAMSVSAPNVVVTAEELLALLPLVRRTADAISGEYSGRTPVTDGTS